MGQILSAMWMVMNHPLWVEPWALHNALDGIGDEGHRFKKGSEVSY